MLFILKVFLIQLSRYNFTTYNEKIYQRLIDVVYNTLCGRTQIFSRIPDFSSHAKTDVGSFKRYDRTSGAGDNEVPYIEQS